MTEFPIVDLSEAKALRFISRTSAMRYGGTSKWEPEIAVELMVEHVLEGSVRKAGPVFRVTARLVEAQTDARARAGKCSGTLDDVFDMQEKVSRAIVDARRARLSPMDVRRLAGRDSPDAEVYNDWHHARYQARTCSPDGLREATARLEGGLQRIDENPAVMAALSFLYGFAAMLGGRRGEPRPRCTLGRPRAGTKPRAGAGEFDYLTRPCLMLRDALAGDRAAPARDLTAELTDAVAADACGACVAAECRRIHGDIGSALPWLERAAEWGWFNYPLSPQTDPFFEPLRGDGRFQAFLDRVGAQCG